MPSFICPFLEQTQSLKAADQLSYVSTFTRKNISKIIKMLLNKYVHKSTVFLDIGANLGIHSLYAAKLGFKVWAVEPQQSNLLKVDFDSH